MATGSTKRTAVAAACAVAMAGAWGVARRAARRSASSRRSLRGTRAPNPYERFPDGRPRVPDALIQTMREMNIEVEEAYGVVRNRGYMNQYEANWQVLKPDQRLIGRAFTVQFLPSRPDLQDGLRADAEAAEARGARQPDRDRSASERRRAGRGSVREGGRRHVRRRQARVLRPEGHRHGSRRRRRAVLSATPRSVRHDGVLPRRPSGFADQRRAQRHQRAHTHWQRHRDAWRHRPGRSRRHPVHPAASRRGSHRARRRRNGCATSGSSRSSIWAPTSPGISTTSRPIRNCDRSSRTTSRRTAARCRRLQARQRDAEAGAPATPAPPGAETEPSSNAGSVSRSPSSKPQAPSLKECR